MALHPVTMALAALAALASSAAAEESLGPLGGATTVVDDRATAYAHLAANAPEERRRDFGLGNRLFLVEWVAFPNAVKIFDGLGPTFNSTQCSGCHAGNGRGRAPAGPDEPVDSALVRLSVAGGAVPHPAYGDQLNDRAIDGVPPEGRVVVQYEQVAGRYGDGTPYTLLRPSLDFEDLGFGTLDGAMTSFRVAPGVIGLGLLEAVPLPQLAALEDPGDEDGDGISGRLSRLDGSGTVGRFGWKANVADLRHQTALAAGGDMGLTTSLVPTQNCPPAQAACRDAPAEAGPEIGDAFLERIVTAMRTIAVPAQRDRDDPEVIAGYAAFARFGCAACHRPTLATDASAALPELRDQVFHPFTDLLLHDMGDGLADGRPDHGATGREWRTAPLWGLGLVPAVNGHDRLLHDGRARGFAEAILWHGGEAEAAREAFRAAPADERAALVAFLASL